MSRIAWKDIPASQRLRLVFIDHCLTAYGSVCRADLTHAFNISVPQASLDLKAFQGLAEPHQRMVYDRSAKRYQAWGKAALFAPSVRSAVVNLVRTRIMTLQTLQKGVAA